VLAGPEETDVPCGMQPALPVAEEGELLGQRGVVVRHALRSRGPMRGEPGAYLPAEALVGGREGEVHRRPLLSITPPPIASEAGRRHEAGTMRFGLATPVVTCHPDHVAAWEGDAGPEELVRIAKAADALGYHHLTCSEHVAIPREVVPVRGGRYYDPLATLG